jgi:hypothetical protein
MIPNTNTKKMAVAMPIEVVAPHQIATPTQRKVTKNEYLKSWNIELLTLPDEQTKQAS